MTTALARPLPPAANVSQLLAEVAHAPECDPLLARRVRLRAGDEVGRYELVREIGRGGFGVVFEARDREGRAVAVKTVRPGARVAAASQSLRREVETARLRHPNIVAVLEGGRCARGPFVVREYVQGETLEERIARGPLPIVDVIRVATAVTRALAHAHARGVLHRDLKPSNVLLSSDGGAKVIDFGLASVSRARAPRGSGTRAYMAPEQRCGGPEDPRTDLFALGLVVHEMATGRPLLQRDGSPAPAATRLGAVQGLPAALERLVAALLEPDPARRPPASRAVLRRLRAIARRIERGADGAVP